MTECRAIPSESREQRISLSLPLSGYWNVLSNGMARTMFSIQATHAHGGPENREEMAASVLIHEGALKMAVNSALS